MKPKQTLGEFDRFLMQRGLRFEAVVVRGAALGLLDVTSRETRDCDVLYPQLPEPLRLAAAEFATSNAQAGMSSQTIG